MIRFIKRIFSNERGNALIMVAGAMPLLIGSAGLATDTIQWAMWKRQLQRAADSGALAGVYSIVQGKSHDDAVTRDLAVNSHVNITTTKVVTRSPGPSWTSDPNAVRVQLSVQKRLGFSSFFLSTPPTITASAVASVVSHGRHCVISLEPTTTTGIIYQGNTVLNLGCGMATNSRGIPAIDVNGTSASVTASPISAVGSITPSSVFASGTELRPYAPVQEDPFAAINPPPVPSPCNANVNVNVGDTMSYSNACFRDLDIQGNVTLTGNIIINGGTMKIGSQANVTCSGCTIFLTNSNTGSNVQIGNVDIHGGATLNMTAPTGGTYAGILFYQDRRATDGNGANSISKINGNSSSFLQGALYFPSQKVEFTGTAGMNVECVQLVAKRLTFSGTSNITNNCPPGSGTRTFDAKSIRLVA